MRARVVMACVIVLSVLAGCASAPRQSFSWREPFTAATALPQQVAVLIDVGYVLRGPDFRQYVAIEDSIELGASVTDAVELEITAARMDVAMKGHYFCSAYREGPQIVATQEEGEIYEKTAPIHLDPTLCRSEKTSAAMVALWRAATNVFGGETSVPADVAYDFGRRYQADTLALVMVVSRKEDSSSSTAPLDLPGTLQAHTGSFVAVVLVRAIDGKVVYSAAVPIPGPQRAGTLRGAIHEAFAGVPRRDGHPAYPIPKLKRAPTSTATTPGQAPGWLVRPRTPAARQVTDLPKFDPNAGRAAVLEGNDTIPLLRRPMALADPIAEVPAGTPVTVYQRDVKWFLVMLPDGRIGWVYQSWVKF